MSRHCEGAVYGDCGNLRKRIVIARSVLKARRSNLMRYYTHDVIANEVKQSHEVILA